jgi:protein gp37
VTKIQWTDVTDNIIVAADGGWWCRKISPGCLHCYAAKLNQSDYFGGNHLPYHGDPPPLRLREDILKSWARQRKPKKHFVASMTDVFGDWVPREWIFSYLDAMAAAPRQIFQVLTKRADVMLREVRAWLKARGLSRVPPHIWLGFSAEDQERLDERAELALQVPADIIWISLEPLLGSIDFSHDTEVGVVSWLAGFDGGDPPAGGLSWGVVGGESGPGARGCFVPYVRSIVQDFRAAGVPIFVKQLGANVIDGNDAGFEGEEDDNWPVSISRENRVEHLTAQNWQGDLVRVHLHHPKGGDPHEWPEDLRIREFPGVRA